MKPKKLKVTNLKLNLINPRNLEKRMRKALIKKRIILRMKNT